MRFLDKLIAEKVYGDIIVSVNKNVAGIFVDYQPENSNSESCEYIYLGDFVEDHKLKEYSSSDKYIFELIKLINKKELFVSMKQIDNKWEVSISNNHGMNVITIERETIPEAMTIATIKAYDLSFDLLVNRLENEDCSFLSDILSDIWVEDERKESINDLDKNGLVREISHFVSEGVRDGSWSEKSWIKDVLDS